MNPFSSVEVVSRRISWWIVTIFGRAVVNLILTTGTNTESASVYDSEFVKVWMTISFSDLFALIELISFWAVLFPFFSFGLEP